MHVPDLGNDCIHQLGFDDKGKLIHLKEEINVEPGSGPRHISYDSKQKLFAYGINELANTITPCWMIDGRLFEIRPPNKEFFSYSTLPKGWTGVQPICKTLTASHTADIHVSPDNRFLYGSNRGHESIVVFKINPETGELGEAIQHIDIGGSIPRSFAITPDGKFLLVAC